MSRDGLLPKVFGEVHPKYGTPMKSTLLVGIVTAITAGFTPIGIVAELTNIGTLAAFIIVSISIIVLRKTRPDLKRSFKVPWVPVIPCLAVLFCGFLITQLPMITIIRFFVWLIIGFLVYFYYSRHHSVLNEEGAEKG